MKFQSQMQEMPLLQKSPSEESPEVPARSAVPYRLQIPLRQEDLSRQTASMPVSES